MTRYLQPSREAAGARREMRKVESGAVDIDIDHRRTFREIFSIIKYRSRGRRGANALYFLCQGSTCMRERELARDESRLPKGPPPAAAPRRKKLISGRSAKCRAVKYAGRPVHCAGLRSVLSGWPRASRSRSRSARSAAPRRRSRSPPASPGARTPRSGRSPCSGRAAGR